MKPQPYGPFPYTPINRRPRLQWPNGARVALWVIPNIEIFALDEPVPGGIGKAPDVINWVPRDYGARVGIFRMMEVMARHGVRGTVALNSHVCDGYPAIIEDGLKLGWEFMGHNETNTRYLNQLPPEEERALIQRTVERIGKATGARPRGWLSSGLTQSWNTLDFLIEAGIEYCADFCNDDQPFTMTVGGKTICAIPYSTEINDIPQILRGGHTADAFCDMICRQFDCLYREGADNARVMAICLHPFIIGMPHRIHALDNALRYICGHAGVWRATGSEIIDAWKKSGATF
ncbi:MAG: polysaccharide deacetylase [Alphaproteobacteria bacterium]|nr:polysaccharide deacetylase [Alphaproteobacteria bacterium]